MTTINEAREAIYARWVANTSIAAANYSFDNEKYDPPDSGQWARLSVRNTGSAQSTLGPTNGRRFRRTASVFVQLYDEVDQGLRQLDILARETRGIFEGVSFSGLRFTNVVIRETGADGKWFQVVVEAFFDYEETK